MTSTQDKGHFFQSTHALKETSRKAQKSTNTSGSPIRLSSKLLSVISDPCISTAVYVAESAGNARRVDLESTESTHIYRGPAAPLTSLALSTKREVLYGGCWDKSVWSWHLKSCQPAQQFWGHTDFVKAVLHANVGASEILITGGADAKIIIWDALTADKLHVLKGDNRGILCLCIDPSSLESAAESSGLTVFSGSSDPDIRCWRLSEDRALATQIEPDNTIHQHETSVNALCFDQDADLWTASSDGTAKCLSRESKWHADTVLRHGDYVRGVLLDRSGRFVVTGGRDEDIKVWERATGHLVHTYHGHFEEITALTMIDEERMVSVSIDATIRSWTLNASELNKLRDQSEEGSGGNAVDGVQDSLLTEDEERELADLMESD